MSTASRLHRATTIVPLAVLSAAWTASLAGVGVTAASADEDGPHTLPDGTVLPAAAIEAPASVGDAVTRNAALTPGSASSIPQAALSAYQRAEAVINKADRGCRIPWELIAAIGRVESDHGRFGGNVLDDEGVARPGIYGIALNGRNNTQRIGDTDGGQYDDDTKWDRAVGPMQFIPSTWSVVGVDGDSDGTRDPQDIDDAALATAVYLCSGDDDLSAEKGQRASVYRYNHSNAYVDLVLSIMQAYMDGDFSAVPTSVLTSGVIMPETRGTGGGSSKGGGKGGGGGGSTDTSTPTVKPTKSPTQTPTQQATPTQTPTQTPTPSETPTSQGPVPTKPPTVSPTSLPTSLPTLPTTLPPLPTATISQTLTLAEAIAQCTLQGVIDLPLTGPNELLDCANKLLNP